MMNKVITGAFIFLLSMHYGEANAQTDTLRVLSYSVLYIGDTPPCQDPHSVLEGYLESIISYVNPDIVGLVKREPEDAYGSAPAPVGFADSLLQFSFNAAYPGRFAYCPYTNNAGGDNISTLYYNQEKLGFVQLLCSYPNITDFDTYELYYKNSGLDTTHDTAFLYVTLNHDNSGSSTSDANTRTAQIEGEMGQIENYFDTLPNMINMGDFNTESSSEGCYQTLVAPSNLNYRYYDPPFYPDATYSYPANWETNPSDYAPCLTVSTRTSGTAPNACSTNYGGGKSWYDHIFLSANIINNKNYISYMPHSFSVIGNDGRRVGNPENASPANTSAPSDVINAIFQMSEHYPIALNLLVNFSKTSVATIQPNEETVTITNPVGAQLDMHFTKGLIGKTISMACIDELGRVQMKYSLKPATETVQIPCTLIPGIYYIRFSTPDQIIPTINIQKK